MTPAIEKLINADRELRAALSEIGAEEVEPAAHTEIARARQATIKARDRLERHERLRRFREGGGRVVPAEKDRE